MDVTGRGALILNAVIRRRPATLLLTTLALLGASCSATARHAAASPHPATPSISAGAGPSAGASGAPSLEPSIPSATAVPSTGPVVSQLLALTLQAPRYRTMGAAVGGDLYLLGGLDAAGVSSADVYRIRPDTAQAVLAGQLVIPTHGGAAVTVGGKILVFGGADVSPDSDVQSFDPSTGATAVIGHMPGPRADLVAAVVGSEIVLLGGFTGSTFVNSVWDTTDGQSFSVLGQVADQERYPAVATVGTSIYLFGGLVSGGEYNGTYSTVIQRYDLATGQSSVVGQFPVPLAHARAAVVAGQVLVFGGWTPAGATSAVWRFDPATGAVAPAGSLPEAVADEAVGVIGNTVYFASGLGTGERPLLEVGSLTP